MLTYLLTSIVLLALFIIYKYILFNRAHISTAKKSLAKFFKFWLMPTRNDTAWQHFIDGEGTFRLSDQLNNNNDIYGGGTSGTW